MCRSSRGSCHRAAPAADRRNRSSPGRTALAAVPASLHPWSPRQWSRHLWSPHLWSPRPWSPRPCRPPLPWLVTQPPGARGVRRHTGELPESVQTETFPDDGTGWMLATGELITPTGQEFPFGLHWRAGGTALIDGLEARRTGAGSADGGSSGMGRRQACRPARHDERGGRAVRMHCGRGSQCDPPCAGRSARRSGRPVVSDAAGPDGGRRRPPHGGPATGTGHHIEFGR